MIRGIIAFFGLWVLLSWVVWAWHNLFSDGEKISILKSASRGLIVAVVAAAIITLIVKVF